MRKFLKISAWVLVACLILVLGVIVTLKLYFTPARIKSFISNYAEANLKRKVSLVSATLNWSGVSIKGLKVSEFPDFKKGEFISVEDFSVHPDLKALFKRQFKIKSILASGLKVNITEVAKNTYNFSDLMRSPQVSDGGKKSGAGGANKAMAFAISYIRLKKSSLSYVNSSSTMAVNLDDIKFNANTITGEGFFPFETNFEMKLKSPYLDGDFPVYIKGLIDLNGLDLDRGKVKIETASLKAGKINCEFKGEFEGFFTPDANLTLGIKPFSSSDLREFTPLVPLGIPIPDIEAVSSFNLTTSSVVFKSLDFKAGPVEGALKGNLNWDPVFDYALDADIKAKIPEMDSGALTENFPAVPKGFHIPNINVEMVSAIRPDKIKFWRSKISADSLVAAFSGEMVQSPFSVSGVVKISKLDMNGLTTIMPALKPYALKGKAGGNLKIQFAKKLALSGKVGFNGVGAKFAGNKLSTMKGVIDISKKLIKSKGIRAKINGSVLKVEFSANNYLTHPTAMLNLDLAALKLSESTQPVKEGAVVVAKAEQKDLKTGSFSFDLKGKSRLGSISHPRFSAGQTSLKYDLKNISTDLKALSGQASFDVKGGKFDNLLELAQRYKIAKVALYPMVILSQASKSAKGVKLPDFNTIVFTKIEGDYLFQNGIMQLRKSNLESNMADAAVSGNINLVTEALDMKISIKLKKASGISMSVPIRLIVKGTFDAPSVKVDIKSILEQPAVKKNVKILTEQGTKLLESLFKKKKK